MATEQFAEHVGDMTGVGGGYGEVMNHESPL
jgi:hypothetical protein